VDWQFQPRQTQPTAKQLQRIRALLDISFEVQRSWQDQYEAFRQWRTRLESAGALAFQATITASDVSDFLSIRVKHLPEIERDLLSRPA
jgi:hypothetical protein